MYDLILLYIHHHCELLLMSEMLFKSSLKIRKIVVYNGFFWLLIACCPKFSALFGESLLSDIQLSDVCRRFRNSAWPSPPVVVAGIRCLHRLPVVDFATQPGHPDWGSLSTFAVDVRRL